MHICSKCRSERMWKGRKTAGKEERESGSCPWELRGYSLMGVLCIYHFIQRKDRKCPPAYTESRVCQY